MSRRNEQGLRYVQRGRDFRGPVYVWENAEGLTFEEWDQAARAGEEAKVRPIVDERTAAHDAAVALGGAEAGRAIRCCYFGRFWQPDYGLRLSAKRARDAWRAGEDPTTYAAMPRPIPRRAAA